MLTVTSTCKNMKYFRIDEQKMQKMLYLCPIVR